MALSTASGLRGPSRGLVACLAGGALLLCAFLMHAFGYDEGNEAAFPVAAVAVHGAGSAETVALSSPDAQAGPASVLHGEDLAHAGATCGDGCGDHDGIQIACMLALLTAGVLLVFFPPRLQAAHHRLRAYALKLASFARAEAWPRTPTPQELSISRT